MKHFYILLLLATQFCLAQVGINTITPSAASVLEVKSSANNINFGGLMPPRVTLAQRNAIPVTSADDGLMVFVISGTTRCLQVYNAQQAVWESIYCINQTPIASAVAISGTTTSGQLLTGSFNYSDLEGNPAGTHTYKWYRANTAAGAGAVEIAGATASTYTLTDADIARYIAFEVTPVATVGSSPGIAVRSNYSAAIAARPTIISFVQLVQSKNENAASTGISLRFSFPNVSTSNVNVTISSNSYGRLTQTAARTIVIPAGTPSPYDAVVFNVNNNTLDDNNVTLTFTITNVTGGSGANSVGTPNTDTCVIVDDEITQTFTENFQAFTGAGFAPTPTAGQLDSDIWRIEGLTAMPWSSTRTTTAFAHGTSNGVLANNAVNHGVWAFTTTGGTNRILGLQPNDESLDGGFYLRIQNTSGVTLTNWDINYLIWQYNDTTSGALDMGVFYSTNDATYNLIPGTSPNFTGAANAWTSYTYSPNIVASVPNNGYLYLYFNFQNAQGYQFGRETGIDNINIIGSNF